MGVSVPVPNVFSFAAISVLFLAEFIWKSHWQLHVTQRSQLASSKPWTDKWLCKHTHVCTHTNAQVLQLQIERRRGPMWIFTHRNMCFTISSFWVTKNNDNVFELHRLILNFHQVQPDMLEWSQSFSMLLKYLIPSPAPSFTSFSLPLSITAVMWSQCEPPSPIHHLNSGCLSSSSTVYPADLHHSSQRVSASPPPVSRLWAKSPCKKETEKKAAKLYLIFYNHK